MVTGRDFAEEADLLLMQDVVAESWRLEKPLVRFHVGDLAWARYQHAGREGEWRIRLWEIPGSGPVGWAWLDPPGDAELFVLPGHRSTLIPEILTHGLQAKRSRQAPSGSSSPHWTETS